MSVILRIFLVLAAIVVLALILRKIKKSEMQTTDAIFWFFFAASFVILAALPEIAYFFANLFGFEAASNFIFLYAIGVLLLREVALTAKVAKTRMRLNALVQEIALREYEEKSTEEPR